MRKSKYSSEESFDVSCVAPKLERIHPMNVAFADALNCKNYRLHDKSLSYDGMTAARTAMLAQKVDTIMRPCKFDDANPVTVLSFMEQFKRTCDSNGVSKGVAMYLLPCFMTKSPAKFLTIRLTPRNGDNVSSLADRGQEERERKFTNV